MTGDAIIYDTYDKNVRKKSRLKGKQNTQPIAKPGLMLILVVLGQHQETTVNAIRSFLIRSSKIFTARPCLHPDANSDDRSCGRGSTLTPSSPVRPDAHSSGRGLSRVVGVVDNSVYNDLANVMQLLVVSNLGNANSHLTPSWLHPLAVAHIYI
ncbi:hypothetical protein EVAR_100288_1 [Eumeta japonica]|uniref:Uncharacterized protein n=1 Tax=Eumeta variegata TaxID=151549 RepID=A0A4C2A815_EUMVA|nr:hypothetical protein EVAR_100288_1 [Eumeta japonica]